MKLKALNPIDENTPDGKYVLVFRPGSDRILKTSTMSKPVKSDGKFYVMVDGISDPMCINEVFSLEE